ncbi:uncharacterized protein LOC119358502 [Triticum dicoccoides]|uniref:uncharacterized protein LOC119358502 n=1 Tax=Triticum dicoccoides TaxID=85692 RepID=UPI00188F4DFF|nr:uncharacterized protein LOC119358502 [Triticum dicoccoides]
MATGREAGEAAPGEEEEQREWADLTPVCLAEAFSWLGLEDLWCGAMACCRSWRAAARSRPALFAALDLRPAFEAVGAALLGAALDPTTRRPGSPPRRRVGRSVRGGGAEGEEGGGGAEQTAEKLQSQASPDDEFENEKFELQKDLFHEVETVDVYSSISCLDLRTLAVLANSTLSSSRLECLLTQSCSKAVSVKLPSSLFDIRSLNYWKDTGSNIYW